MDLHSECSASPDNDHYSDAPDVSRIAAITSGRPVFIDGDNPDSITRIESHLIPAITLSSAFTRFAVSPRHVPAFERK